MQYVDGFLEFGDVHHAVSAARLPDANFSCTDAHIVKRLPIDWLKSSLNLSQLEARFLSSIS